MLLNGNAESLPEKRRGALFLKEVVINLIRYTLVC